VEGENRVNPHKSLLASGFLLAVLFLSACGIPPATATPTPITTSIEGKVYRADTGQANQGTRISIYDSSVTFENLHSSEPVYETTAISEGEYKFYDVQEGSYRILVSLPGSDPSLSTCTRVPEPWAGWRFLSLSFDSVGKVDTINYWTESSFQIAIGEHLRRDFAWECR
jgi:hypothetical protein